MTRKLGLDAIEIERLYASGMALRTVGKEMGVSDDTILRRMRELGLPTRQPVRRGKQETKRHKGELK